MGLPWGRGKQPRSHEGRSRSACAGGPTAAYYSTPPRLTQPPWEFNGKSALQMHCECSLDVTICAASARCRLPAGPSPVSYIPRSGQENLWRKTNSLENASDELGWNEV